MPRNKTIKQKRRTGWINQKEMAASIGISAQAFVNWGLQPVARIGREIFYTVDDVIDHEVEKALKKGAHTTT